MKMDQILSLYEGNEDVNMEEEASKNPAIVSMCMFEIIG